VSILQAARRDAPSVGSWSIRPDAGCFPLDDRGPFPAPGKEVLMGLIGLLVVIILIIILLQLIF